MSLARPQEIASVLRAHLTQFDGIRMLTDTQDLLHGRGDARREVLDVVSGVYVALPAVHDAVVVVFTGHEILGLETVACNVTVQGVRLLRRLCACLGGALVHETTESASCNMEVDFLPLAFVVGIALVDEDKWLPQPFPSLDVVRCCGLLCARSTVFFVAVKNK